MVHSVKLELIKDCNVQPDKLAIHPKALGGNKTDCKLTVSNSIGEDLFLSKKMGCVFHVKEVPSSEKTR